MPRRPSAIAALMSRSDSSMARSLGNRPGHPSGRTRATPLKRRSRRAVDVREDAYLLPARREATSPDRPEEGVPEDIRMKSMRVQAVLLVTAVVAGYAGAATYSALAAPPVEIAT